MKELAKAVSYLVNCLVSYLLQLVIMFRAFSYVAALFVAKLNLLSITALKSKTAPSDLISKS